MNTRKVQNVHDAFAWDDHCIDVLKEGDNETEAIEPDTLANLLDETDISTAFSGIAAPETSMNCLAAKIHKRVPGRRLPHVKVPNP